MQNLRPLFQPYYMCAQFAPSLMISDTICLLHSRLVQNGEICAPFENFNPNLPKFWENFPIFFVASEVFWKVDEQFAKKKVHFEEPCTLCDCP